MQTYVIAIVSSRSGIAEGINYALFWQQLAYFPERSVRTETAGDHTYYRSSYTNAVALVGKSLASDLGGEQGQ